VNADKPHGERIATLEAKATGLAADIGRVEKANATLEKRNWVLIAGLAAFLAAQFFDIFKGGK
jgi:hypothetical protein